jgi:hypothetical protein
MIVRSRCVKPVKGIRVRRRKATHVQKNRIDIHGVCSISHRYRAHIITGHMDSGVTVEFCT